MNINLTADQIALLGGVATGLMTWKLLDLGSGILPQVIGFVVGAAPGAALSLAAADADPTNIKLVERSLDMLSDWPIGPVTVGIVWIGMTTVLSVAYALFVEPEVGAFTAFIPLLNLRDIDVAIALLSGAATLYFAGIAGWVVEIVQWIATTGGDMKKVPAKPGGRVKWGFKKLPKDFVYFILAAPIGIYDTVKLAISKGSFVPLLFVGVKIAMDQWTRLGDLIIDLVATVQDVEAIAKDSWSFFDHLVKGLFISGVKSNIPTGGTVPAVKDPYKTILQAKNVDGNYWPAYPRLFNDGDNDDDSS